MSVVSGTARTELTAPSWPDRRRLRATSVAA
jgi:hypothetical protein